jgi:hypothetical protein
MVYSPAMNHAKLNIIKIIAITNPITLMSNMANVIQDMFEIVTHLALKFQKILTMIIIKTKNFKKLNSYTIVVIKKITIDNELITTTTDP